VNSYILASDALAEYFKADSEWCRLQDLFHRTDGKRCRKLKDRARIKIREREQQLAANVTWAASNDEICLILMTASDSLQLPGTYLHTLELGDAIRAGSAAALNLSDEYAAWNGARLLFERDQWRRWVAKPAISLVATPSLDGGSLSLDPSVSASRKGAGRRGAAVPIAADDAILAEMIQAHGLNSESFSVRSYVLSNDKRIRGPSPEAKIRRFQRKFKNLPA